MLSQDKKEKISIEVIKTLYSRFCSFPEDGLNNRNAPFHEAFLKAFKTKLDDKVSDIPLFISLSSWLQGLNTTLGQTFFENVAHILSDGEKREYTSRKLGNLKIHRTQKDNVNSIITALSNSECNPEICSENLQILILDDNELVNAIDFSADVFIEDDNKIVAIELKSVKPNSGEMRGEKQKILEGKSALYCKSSNKEIEFYLGFPFDPTNDPKRPTEFEKNRFMSSCINMSKFFAEEIKIASELWDFLSNEENTMEQLLEIINTISTVEFMEKYEYLNSNENRHENKYLEMLEAWNLFSEKKLIENIDIIEKGIKGNSRLTRTYNQKIFKNSGYNHERFMRLSELFPNS